MKKSLCTTCKNYGVIEYLYPEQPGIVYNLPPSDVVGMQPGYRVWCKEKILETACSTTMAAEGPRKIFPTTILVEQCSLFIPIKEK